MYRAMWVAALALSLALAPAVSAKEPKNKKQDVSAIGERDVDGKVNFYSIEKEIALGRGLAQQIERNARIITDPVIAEYVNRIGQNLVRNSDAKVPFTIKVIDSDEVNAFALPGGFFYVNSGLIKKAEDEAELAGVMAHEIAHVAARHGTRQATRGQIANLVSIPLIFLGGWGGYAVRQAAGFAVPMTFLKFSRGFEKEADLLGVQYLYATGYDPSEMVEFFERLQAMEKRKTGKLAAAFKTHPPTGKRIKIVQKTIDELLPSKPEYLVSTSEFADVKQRLVRLTTLGRKSFEESDPNRPTLKRKSPGGKIEPLDRDGSSGDEGDEDERPTLKRRQLSENRRAAETGS